MRKNKTQKIVIVILVIAAILGIGGIAIAYYISSSADDPFVGLGERHSSYCSYIVAYTTPQCNTCDCSYIETQALESRIAPVIDGNCTIDESELLIDEETQEAFSEDDELSLLFEDEETELINCLIPSVRYSSCHSVSIRNYESTDLILPPIPTHESILIDAVFVPEPNEEFNRFQFTINGEVISVSEADIRRQMVGDETRYIPNIEFKDFEQANTLTVSANAFSNINPEGISQSKYCYKQYNLSTGLPPTCTSLETKIMPNTNIIQELNMRVPHLHDTENISIEFSFDKEYDNFVLENISEELMEVLLVNNVITLEQEYLYPTGDLRNMYSNNAGFPILDVDIDDATRINAQIYVNGDPIDSNLCYTYLTLHFDEEPTVPDPDPVPVPDPDPEPEPEPEPDPEEELPDTGIIHFVTITVGASILILGVLIYQDRFTLVNPKTLNNLYKVVIRPYFETKEHFEEKTIESMKNKPKKT